MVRHDVITFITTLQRSRSSDSRKCWRVSQISTGGRNGRDLVHTVNTSSVMKWLLRCFFAMIVFISLLWVYCSLPRLSFPLWWECALLWHGEVHWRELCSWSGLPRQVGQCEGTRPRVITSLGEGKCIFPPLLVTPTFTVSCEEGFPCVRTTWMAQASPPPLSSS